LGLLAFGILLVSLFPFTPSPFYYNLVDLILLQTGDGVNDALASDIGIAMGRYAPFLFNKVLVNSAFHVVNSIAEAMLPRKLVRI
jgi:hypothetical protein